MEELIAEFDAVMQRYNDAYTEARSQEDRDKINLTFEEIISSAEREMEEKIETFLKEEQIALEKEQQESELTPDVSKKKHSQKK